MQPAPVPALTRNIILPELHTPAFANPWRERPGARPEDRSTRGSHLRQPITREQLLADLQPAALYERSRAAPRNNSRTLQPIRDNRNAAPGPSPSTLPFAPGPNYSIPDTPIPPIPQIPLPPIHPAGFRLPRTSPTFAQLASSLKIGRLSDRREIMEKYVTEEEQKWETTLDEMIAMEDAFRIVWKDQALQHICHDPGRKLYSMKFPDDGLVRFLKTEYEIVALRRNVIYAAQGFPRHWADLRTYCAFVGRYALPLRPSEYIWILKVWEVRSIAKACKIISYGFQLPPRLLSSVCLLLLNDPYFLAYDSYGPAFLSRALTSDEFFTAISYETFSSPAFQIGCPLDVITTYLRNSLLPEAAVLEANLSTTFSCFTANFAKLLDVIKGFETETGMQIYRGVLDNVFTSWHYALVKKRAPAPWTFYVPSMQVTAKLWLAMPEQQKMIARARQANSNGDVGTSESSDEEEDEGQGQEEQQHKIDTANMKAESKKRVVIDLTKEQTIDSTAARVFKRNVAIQSEKAVDEGQFCVEIDEWGNKRYVQRFR